MHEKRVRGPDGKIRTYLITSESTPFISEPTEFDRVYSSWMQKRIEEENRREQRGEGISMWKEAIRMRRAKDGRRQW